MNSNVDKVLREIFSKPTYRFHIRELARLTRLNPNTIINIVRKLERDELLKKEAKKNVVEVYLNFENNKVRWRKRLFNISEIYKSGLVELLVERYSPSSISLIGSYSRGEDIEQSDIDVIMFAKNKKIIDLSKFEKILNRKIHLLIAEKEKISDEFFNNLINGLILYGYLRK